MKEMNLMKIVQRYAYNLVSNPGSTKYTDGSATIPSIYYGIWLDAAKWTHEPARKLYLPERIKRSQNVLHNVD